MHGGVTTAGAAALISAATCARPAEQRPAPSSREGAAALATEELSRFGFAPGQVVIEERTGPEAVSDAEAWLALGFSDSHFDGLAVLRDAVGIDDARSGAELRRAVAELRAPAMPVYYAVDRKALAFQPSAHLGDAATDRALVGALVHAFQDQQMGGLTASLVSSEELADVARAQLCAIEGHAAMAAAAVIRGRSGFDPATADVDGFGPLHPRVRSGFAEVPCPAGGRFMAEAFRRGGWGEVLQRTGAPPPSTEAIMHVSKLDQDFPTAVGLPPWDEEALGKARLIRDDSLGEIGIYRLLIEKGLPRDKARIAALGWDGDRLHVYELPGGARVLMWRSVWDREQDAVQFRDAVHGDKLRVAHRGRLLNAVACDEAELLRPLQERMGGVQEPPLEEADAKSTAALESGPK